MISASMVGVMGKLIISQKLKKILERQNHKGLQFFPISVIYKGEKIENYWLTNHFEFDYDCIDIAKCEFNLYNAFDYTVKKKLSISTYQQLMQFISELAPPKMFKIENLFLKEGSEDFLLIKWVNGGVGYYVSEKLKLEIENAGCTGITFSKSNERYP